VFKGWGSAPRPLLLLNHGRATDAQGRAALGRARYGDAASFFTQRGFIVAVPTRVGYGVSGGEDVEDTGDCGKKRFEPGYDAAAQVSVQVLAWMRQRADVSPERTVVAGQSYGGATAIALAAKGVPNVVAAINFAGGGGGNPKTRPGRPCDAHLMKRMFAGYGQTSRIPTLWIYSENDLFMGKDAPREWFDAFQAAGGQGEFVQFPPNGEDGHSLFTRAPEVWQPSVIEFLKSQGF
jgi:dienelactone hydrolase